MHVTKWATASHQQQCNVTWPYGQHTCYMLTAPAH